MDYANRLRFRQRLAQLGKLTLGGIAVIVALIFVLSGCSPDGMGEDDIVAEMTHGLPDGWSVAGSDEIESAGLCVDGCTAEVDIEIATPRSTPARIRAQLRKWLVDREWEYLDWEYLDQDEYRDNQYPLGCSFNTQFGAASVPDDHNDRHGIITLIPRQESPERLVLNIRKGAGT